MPEQDDEKPLAGQARERRPCPACEGGAYSSLDPCPLCAGAEMVEGCAACAGKGLVRVAPHARLLEFLASIGHPAATSVLAICPECAGTAMIPSPAPTPLH